MADILQYTNYTSSDNTLPTLYADAAIDGGTIVCADFLDPAGYPNGSLPAAPIAVGQQFFNYVDQLFTDLALTGAGSTAGIGTTGLTFDTLNEHVSLPPSCKLAATATHWLVGGWVKIGATQPGSGIPCGAACADASYYQWVWMQSNGGGLQYNLRAGNSTVSYTFPAAGVYQVFAEFVVSGGNITTNVYVGTPTASPVLVGTTTAAVPSGGLPVPTSAPAINPGSPYGGSFQGQIGRFLFEDLTKSGAASSALAFVQNDYLYNNGRFS